VHLPRNFTTVYTPQRSAAIDEWVMAGRQRFGQVRLFRREDGFKAIVKALRKGSLLYLLPDMNFRMEDSIFVPFYGVPAATVTTLPRLLSLRAGAGGASHLTFDTPWLRGTGSRCMDRLPHRRR
jgi:KDO2-lipid IV(A) lauroyltransferase